MLSGIEGVASGEGRDSSTTGASREAERILCGDREPIAAEALWIDLATAFVAACSQLAGCGGEGMIVTLCAREPVERAVSSPVKVMEDWPLSARLISSIAT
jgi:hypothetical protein